MCPFEVKYGVVKGPFAKSLRENRAIVLPGRDERLLAGRLE